MQTQSGPNLDELLQHTTWLRKLAYRLAGAPDVADDIVQDTLSVALRNPPDPGRPARPWLAGVLRNLVRKRNRDDGRRAQGDTRAFLDPSLGNGTDFKGSPEDLTQQAQAFRILAELVCELDDARRTVVLLRFYQDQTSEQIGRVLAIPPGTARRQLKEALDLLRERMDRRHGGSRAWAGILLPRGIDLAKPPLEQVATFPLAKLLAGLALTTVVGLAIYAARAPGATAPIVKKPGVSTPREFARMAILTESGTAQTAQIPGTVVDEKGAAVNGASVLLHCSKGCPRTWAGDRVTTTDASGAFQFGRLGNADYSVTASADNYLGSKAKTHVQDAMSSAPLRLVLKVGGFTVEGTVSDVGGGSVGGAVVLVGSDESPALAVTKDDGKYRLRLPSGTFGVSVEADGYANAQGEAIEVAGNVIRNFTLSPAATISGQVVDREGDPVAGALVMASASAPENYARYATAGDDGRFRFPRLVAGRFQISAREGSGWGMADGLLDVSASSQLSDVRVVLEARPVVNGLALDRSKKPITDCKVRVESGASQAGLVRGDTIARCDQSGHFTIDGLPPGRFTVQARAAGYSWSTQEFLLKDQSLNVELTLDRGVMATGLVLDPGGRPVAGAEVQIETRISKAVDGVFNGAASVKTGSDGRFPATPLGSGFLSARVRHASFGSVETTIPVNAGETPDVKLQFQPGAFVSGRVVWDDGKPAGKVIARWQGGREQFKTTTDADGRFRLGPVPALGYGELAAKASADGSDRIGGPPSPEKKTLNLKPGEESTGHLLTLGRPDKAITGRAVGPDQQPVANVRIMVGPFHLAYRVANGAVPGGFGTFETTTDSDGKFRVTGLAKGDYSLVALPVAHPLLSVPNVKAPSHDVVLHLGVPCQIRATVKDTGGAPVATIEFFARPRPPEPDPSQPIAAMAAKSQIGFGGLGVPWKRITTTDGSFAISQLAEGDYEVMVRTPDERYGGAARVRATGEGVGAINLTVRSGQTVKGHVVAMDTGAPMAGFGIALANRAALFETTTNDNGDFQLRGVFPGLREVLQVRSFLKHIPESIAVDVPADGSNVDLGTIAIMPAPPPPVLPSGDVPRVGMVSPGLMVEPFSHPPTVFASLPGSPAAAAGVRAGSTILEIDGHDLRAGGAMAAMFLLGLPGTGPAHVKLQLPGGSVQSFTLEKVDAKTLGLPSLR